MNCNKLNRELNEIIKTFLWGNLEIWKQKLDIVNNLAQVPYLSLSPVSTYRLYSNIIDSEDCVFCKKCGEKTLWFALSFNHTMCETCEKYN